MAADQELGPIKNKSDKNDSKLNHNLLLPKNKIYAINKEKSVESDGELDHNLDGQPDGQIKKKEKLFWLWILVCFSLGIGFIILSSQLLFEEYLESKILGFVFLSIGLVALIVKFGVIVTERYRKVEDSSGKHESSIEVDIIKDEDLEEDEGKAPKNLKTKTSKETLSDAYFLIMNKELDSNCDLKTNRLDQIKKL